jgi:hypothetical protein
MRVVAITVVALGLAVVGAGGAMPLRISSGLHGVVLRGPTKPVCPEEQSCEAPAPGIVLQFRRVRLGLLVAQVRTNAAGMYTVRLAAGIYSVTTQRRTIGTGLTPRVVRVPIGRLARVNFHLDTGIQ